jgi:hypothetical protein
MQVGWLVLYQQLLIILQENLLQLIIFAGYACSPLVAGTLLPICVLLAIIRRTVHALCKEHTLSCKKSCTALLMLLRCMPVSNNVGSLSSIGCALLIAQHQVGLCFAAVTR